MWLTAFVIVFLAVAATGVAAAVLDRRFARPAPVARRSDPDAPVPLGFKMAWLALRAPDAAVVAEALGLEPAEVIGWQSGVAMIYDPVLGRDHIFVSPAVNGIVLVAGLSLPHPLGPGYVDKLSRLLEALSRKFGEAQYFMTYPPIDFFAWARARQGRIVRAYAIGEDGVIVNRGRPLSEEKSLGLSRYELRGVRGRSGDAGGEMLLHPTESHVAELAGLMGLDPTRLGPGSAEPATGLIGRAPSAWRAQRRREAA